MSRLNLFALLLSSLLGLSIDAFAQPKYGFGFAPTSSDASYKSYKKKYPYCVKVGATNFKAATRYKAGVAKFPKASATVAKANKVCKTLGQQAAAGSVTIKLAPSLSSQSGANISTDTASRCSIRITSTGSQRVICEGLESTTSSTFDLPNGSTLIETSQPGSSLPIRSQGSTNDTCRYQFVSAGGKAGCLVGLGSITYQDTSPLSTNGALPTFQMLSTGDVVFIGGVSELVSGTHIFKLSSTGVLSQLASVSSSNETFEKLLVESGDRVVIVGKIVDQGLGDSAPYVKLISAAGEVSTVVADTRTIGGSAVSFLTKDYDNRAVVGLTNVGSTVTNVSTARIVKLSPNGTSLDNIISSASASPTSEVIDTFCSSAVGALTSFCDYGGTYVTSMQTTTTALYGVTRTQATGGSHSLPTCTALIRYTPSLQQISLSNVDYPLFVGGIGKYLLVSGLNSSNEGVIVKYDTESAAEEVIASGIYSPLTFRYSIKNSTLVGFANRQSDLAQMFYQLPYNSALLGSAVSTTFPLSSGVIGTIRFAY